MSYVNNPFALLDSEDGGAAAGRVSKKGGKKPLPAGSFPGEQPAGAAAAKPRTRVDARHKETHATEGGMRGGRPGGRGGRGGSGRGGRGGFGHDPSVRQFDRRGAPTRHAPHYAQKDGAALGLEGGIDVPVQQGDSVEDVVEVPAADVEEMVFDIAEPEEDVKTLDEYLASKQLVEDDKLEAREVIIDESQFNKVRPMKSSKKTDEEEEEAEQERQRQKKKKERKVLNLDEFRGGREADSKYRAPVEFAGRGGFRGGRGGPRGGATPFTGAPRGGRGGFRGVGVEGAAPRGGRGGFAPRGGRGGRGGFGAAAPVAINDKAAFPALGGQ